MKIEIIKFWYFSFIIREFRLDEDEALMLYLDHVFGASESQTVMQGMSKLDKARIAIREISAKDGLMKKLMAMYSKVGALLIRFIEDYWIYQWLMCLIDWSTIIFFWLIDWFLWLWDPGLPVEWNAEIGNSHQPNSSREGLQNFDVFYRFLKYISLNLNILFVFVNVCV